MHLTTEYLINRNRYMIYRVKNIFGTKNNGTAKVFKQNNCGKNSKNF